MVFKKEVNSNTSTSSSESKNSKNQKIYTCAEVEARTEKSFPRTPTLKRVDPAIMRISSMSSHTRYMRDELEALRDTTLARAPPACFFDPRIRRLNILNEERPEDQEAQMKAFQNMLPNLSSKSWDPEVLDLLNNYHRSLLCPQYDYTSNSYNQTRSPRTTINQNFNRRVSWGDQKQFLDNQHKKYESKNFFDHITTTTTMRPPPRMGVGSFWYPKNMKYQPQSQFRNAKGNSCANERHSYYPANNSLGSSFLSESKSSYDESMDKSTIDRTNDSESSSKVAPKVDDEEDNASEIDPPEWYTCPVSRSDVIDLHGFEEDETGRSDTGEPSSQKDQLQQNPQRGSDGSGASFAYRRSGYNQQYARNGRAYPNSLNSSSSSYYKPCFRNPLHNSRSSANSTLNRSMNQNIGNLSNEMEVMTIDPFFEMWKRKNAQQESMNLMNFMNPAGQMRTMSDLETAMRQNGQYQHPNQQQMYGMPNYGNNANLQQFFQNAAFAGMNPRIGAQMTAGMRSPQGRQPFGFENFQPGTTPTPEQLQQHTSEIMRNAILRKHFSDDKKFPK